MTPFTCPHCGKRTISLWTRLSLGTERPAVCAACGKNVGVRSRSTWLLVMFFVAFFVARQGLRFALDTEATYAIEGAVAVAFVVVFCAAWVRWVPLVKR